MRGQIPKAGARRGARLPLSLDARSQELGSQEASLTALCQVLFKSTQPNWGLALCVLWPVSRSWREPGVATLDFLPLCLPRPDLGCFCEGGRWGILKNPKSFRVLFPWARACAVAGWAPAPLSVPPPPSVRGDLSATPGCGLLTAETPRD